MPSIHAGIIIILIRPYQIGFQHVNVDPVEAVSIGALPGNALVLLERAVEPGVCVGDFVGGL